MIVTVSFVSSMSITFPTTRVLIYLRKSRSKGFSLFAMDSRRIILMVKKLADTFQEAWKSWKRWIDILRSLRRSIVGSRDRACCTWNEISSGFKLQLEQWISAARNLTGNRVIGFSQKVIKHISVVRTLIMLWCPYLIFLFDAGKRRPSLRSLISYRAVVGTRSTEAPRRPSLLATMTVHSLKELPTPTFLRVLPATLLTFKKKSL